MFDFMNERNKTGSKLRIAGVSGSDDRDCKNCKYHDAKKLGCKHKYWNNCVVRDKDGLVIDYNYHEYHYR